MLKLLAIFLMTYNHVNYFLLPDLPRLSLINYNFFALSIFCWMTVQGYIYTSDFRKYLLTMLLFACITQPIYHIMYPGYMTPNFMFSLFWGLVIIHLKDHFWKYSYLFFLPLLAFRLIHIDMVWILFWHVLKDYKFNDYIRLLPRVKIGKYFFYIYFPGHYFIIYLIQNRIA